jgi:hypothetical protein
VHYADSPALEAEQRKRVLEAVGRGRADINALLYDRNKPGVYDRKVAMALQFALDGETASARALIEETRADLIKERANAGRVQYLTCAAVSFLVLMVLFLSISLWWSFPNYADDFRLAGAAGLVGAAFSIVLAVRRRTVALDTDRRSNTTDGLLRLIIGAVSGGVLVLLLSSNVIPELMLGQIRLAPWGSDVPWKAVLLVGFVAGFLERLVPELLDKATPQPMGAPRPAS